MLSDFVSLPPSVVPPHSAFSPLISLSVHLPSSQPLPPSLPVPCLSLSHLSFTSTVFVSFHLCFYSCLPSSLALLSSIPIFFYSHIFSLSFGLSPLFLHSPSSSILFGLSLSLSLVSPTLSSICATIPLSQLRSQLFPASAPAFPWRGSPALPRAPSLPRFGGQPADVAQHLLLLHRQGEVMSRLANSVPSEYVCVCLRVALHLWSQV